MAPGFSPGRRPRKRQKRGTWALRETELARSLSSLSDFLVPAAILSRRVLWEALEPSAARIRRQLQRTAESGKSELLRAGASPLLV